MKTSKHSTFIDNYFGLLNSLSKENKIRLIARLSNSILNEVEDKEGIVDRFFGAFISAKSAEVIIKEIKESRNFTRTIEAF